MADGYLANQGNLVNVLHADTPSDDWEQYLHDPAKIPVYYKGSGGVWGYDSVTNFAFKNTTDGRINYNSESGGDWSQSQCSNNYYVAYWIFATNKPNIPIIAIQGQRQDRKLSQARSSNTIDNLVTNGLPFESMKILYRLIFQTSDSFSTGTRKAELVDVQDMRGTPSATFEYSPTQNHSELEGIG